MADPVISQALEMLKSPEPRIVEFFCNLLWAQLATGTGDIGDHYVEKIERRRTYHCTSSGTQHDFLLAYVKAISNGSLTPRQTYLILIERSGTLGCTPPGQGLMSSPRCAVCEGDLVLSIYRSLLGSPPEDMPCDAIDTIQVLPDQSRLCQSTCIAHVEFPVPGYSGCLSDPTEFSPMPESSSDADARRFPLFFHQLCLMAKRTHVHYKTWDRNGRDCQFYCAALLHLTRLATRCSLVLRVAPQKTKVVRWVDDMTRERPGVVNEYALNVRHSKSWWDSFVMWWDGPFVAIEREPSNEMLRPLLRRLHDDVIEFEPQASKLRRKVMESGRWNVDQRKWLRDVIRLLQEKSKKLGELHTTQTTEAEMKAQNDVERIAAQILYILDTRNA